MFGQGWVGLVGTVLHRTRVHSVACPLNEASSPDVEVNWIGSASVIPVYIPLIIGRQLH